MPWGKGFTGIYSITPMTKVSGHCQVVEVDITTIIFFPENNIYRIFTARLAP
jgi:hypothetical protein